jgi:hypothetical protein
MSNAVEVQKGKKKMNKLRAKINAKGYTLEEFLNHIGFSLRWYRIHEKEGAARNKWLKSKVNELDRKKLKEP